MKKIIFTLILISRCFSAISQDNKPQILLEPANWEFEKFGLPPAFAPQITYKGFEEIRFAPGMFNKDSANYFTYAFVAALDTLTTISENDVKNYLLFYFKGLCGTTARDRNLKIDTTRITATVKRLKNKPSTPGLLMHEATVNLFGVFTDGAPVKLNMDIAILNNSITRKTYIFFLASPRDRNETIWKELYTIRNKGYGVIGSTGNR